MTETMRCEQQFRSVAAWLAAGVAIIGALVLVGWVFDIPVLVRLRPGWTQMRANTALVMVALGLGLWLLARQPRGTTGLRRALGFGVALVGAATVAEYIFGLDLGIDQLTFRAPTSGNYPGRMAPQTAATFAILGTAVAIDGWVSPTVVRVAGYLGLASGFIACFGYLYGEWHFYELGMYAAITLHTAIAFALAGASLLAARPAGGLVRLLAAGSGAGRVLRWLLPAIILVPALTGWLQLFGEDVGYYDREFGVALTTLMTVSLLGVVVAILAGSLDRSDQAVRSARSRLEADVDAMTRLHQIAARSSAASAPLQPVLAEVVDAAVAIAEADFGNIQVLDEHTGALTIVAQQGLPPWWLEYWTSVTPGQGSCGAAPELGERVIVEDVEDSPLFRDSPALDIQRRAGVRAVFSTPLYTRSGEPLGMLSVHHRHPHRPSERCLKLIDLLARQAADIIERTRADTRLRESAQRFRALVEASAQIVWTTDEHGVVVEDSPTWRAFTGQTHEELLGWGWLAAVHPDDRAKVESSWRHTARRPHATTSEYRVRHHTGAWRWVYVHAVPLADPEGKVRGWVGMSTDVTVKKREHQGRMRQLREMVEHAPHSVAMFDNELRFVEVSPTWMREFHLTSDIIGKHHYEVFPEIPERWREVHCRALAGETETNEGEPFLRADGTTQWVRWKVCPWRDLEGKIGGILIYSEDITAQRAADEAARIMQEHLRLAQRVARIGTFDWNIVTGVNTWTPELEQMYGLPLGGFPRTQEAWEQLVHPDDRAEAVRHVEEALETGQPVEAEWRVRWPDGSTHWITARFQAFRDESGKPQHLIGINIDTTERKLAEENLERRVAERTRELAVARDRLEHDIAERMRLEEEQARRHEERAILLKEIHHRVKNNLQVISSLFYLQADRTKNATVRKLLDESRGRLLTIALIHDKLYRSEHLAFIDFGEYLKDLTATLTSAIGVQAPNVVVHVQADEVFLDIDRAMPCALIINELVSNSMRHAFPGGRSGEVRIVVTRTETSLDLEVADDGIGFPDDLDVQNVTTLGLQLVTTLAHQLRADLELVRRGGTAFRIHLALPATTQAERTPDSTHA